MSNEMMEDLRAPMDAAVADLNSPRLAILKEREKTHGQFRIQGAFAHQMKMIFRQEGNYTALRDDQREALDMIATKISRLLCGDPMHKDTWTDIAGYAQLGAEACEQ